MWREIATTMAGKAKSGVAVVGVTGRAQSTEKKGKKLAKAKMRKIYPIW